MRNKTQHTPTPWYLPNGEDKNQFGTYRIAEQPGQSAAHLTNIALVGSLEDAAFIVRAVNSHEALLEACQEAYDLLASKETLSAEAVEVWGHLQLAISQAEAGKGK